VILHCNFVCRVRGAYQGLTLVTLSELSTSYGVERTEGGLFFERLLVIAFGTSVMGMTFLEFALQRIGICLPRIFSS